MIRLDQLLSYESPTENRSSEFLTRSVTNRTVQIQKQARSLKFHIYVEDELFYPYLLRKNKDADQLCSYFTADLCLCFHIGKIQFSGDAAYMFLMQAISGKA